MLSISASSVRRQEKIVAEPVLWDFGDGRVAHALAYRTDSDAPGTGTIPGPQFDFRVGDEVCMLLRNDLRIKQQNYFPGLMTITSLHPHGIDVPNASDGTQITQNGVSSGEEHLYRFRTDRAGMFILHPHFQPGNQIALGLFSTIIVRDAIEKHLIEHKILPEREISAVFSEIVFPSDTNRRVLPQQVQLGAPPTTPLINGRQTPTTFSAKNGEWIRLRVFNVAIFNPVVVRVLNSSDNTLYRIGGEGGLLDTVRIEGGTMGKFDTHHPRGTVFLGSGNRADCVFLVQGTPGEFVDIEFNGKVLVRFHIREQIQPLHCFGEGMPLRMIYGHICRGLALSHKNHLLDPNKLHTIGSDNPVITLSRSSGGGDPFPAIDGVRGQFDFQGVDDFRLIPHIATSRFCRVGDVLELSVQNTTFGMHPFHIHGFPFQLVKIEKIEETKVGAANANVEELLYVYNYVEFVDTIIVPPFTRFTFWIHVFDRSAGAQLSSGPGEKGGGALGRWVFHCHQALHAERGMISELVVIPKEKSVCKLAGICV